MAKLVKGYKCPKCGGQIREDEKMQNRYFCTNAGDAYGKGVCIFETYRRSDLVKEEE